MSEAWQLWPCKVASRRAPRPEDRRRGRPPGPSECVCVCLCSRLKLWSVRGFVEVDGMSGMAGGTTSTQICCFVNPADCKQGFYCCPKCVNKVAQGWID